MEINYLINRITKSFPLLIVVFSIAVLILYFLFGGTVAALGALVLAGGYVAYHFLKVKNHD